MAIIVLSAFVKALMRFRVLSVAFWPSYKRNDDIMNDKNEIVQ